MRFLYCACAISAMLDDWRGVNIPKAVEFIRSSTSYDGGIAQRPMSESHGGSTYCAIAALSLMQQLDQGLADRQRTLQWCLRRQIEGFQGRINKPGDTCYSFWIGASLQLLGGLSLANRDANLRFLGKTATEYGGFGKEENDYPGNVYILIDIIIV